MTRHKSDGQNALCLGRPVRGNRIRRKWDEVTCPNCIGMDRRTMTERIPDRQARLAVVDALSADESDGVFWGMMEEFGLDADDLLAREPKR